MKDFKIKSSLLVGALVMMLCYNLLCLKDLYKGISAQTRELVEQSLRDADLDEVLNRATKYPEINPDIAYQGKSMSQSRSIRGDTLHVTIVDGNDSVMATRTTPLAPGTNYSDIMVNEIGYGAHQTIDPVYKLRIADMDSLFRLSLSRKGINLEVASVLSVDSDNKLVAGDARLRSAAGLDSITVCYNLLSGESYVAYFSPPDKYIFDRMKGIVLSTAAIILLIAMAFMYLFHTVSRLRTIEEMKDDFVSNMTHELKTPIAIAYSANDALLNYDTGNDPSKRENYLKIANRQLKRLGELVENILSMSMERRKTMKLKPETIRLGPFTEEIAAAQRMRGGKQIEIEVEADGDVCVEADRTHLTNVLNNLIDNATKYSGESVRIVVGLDSKGISVSDNGIGIPQKSLPYIFNKFYRVPHGNRQDVRGYGIGLYYVKSILDKMGWSIDVKSKTGEGSVFTIKFSKNG